MKNQNSTIEELRRLLADSLSWNHETISENIFYLSGNIRWEGNNLTNTNKMHLLLKSCSQGFVSPRWYSYKDIVSDPNLSIREGMNPTSTDSWFYFVFPKEKGKYDRDFLEKLALLMDYYNVDSIRNSIPVDDGKNIIDNGILNRSDFKMSTHVVRLYNRDRLNVLNEADSPDIDLGSIDSRDLIGRSLYRLHIDGSYKPDDALNNASCIDRICNRLFAHNSYISPHCKELYSTYSSLIIANALGIDTSSFKEKKAENIIDIMSIINSEAKEVRDLARGSYVNINEFSKISGAYKILGRPLSDSR